MVAPEELPICDVCNKPVDRVECDRSLFTKTITYWVFCHGAVETFDVDQMVINAAHKVEIGRAFTQKQKQLEPKK